jgi:hypothetical protein
MATSTKAQSKTDEIIVGVRMRSKVGKLLLGSTAQHVILNAPPLSGSYKKMICPPI